MPKSNANEHGKITWLSVLVLAITDNHINIYNHNDIK